MADQSSNKKPRFLPDPSKWIQTAPSSSSAKKPQPQRPLTYFRNTFATPPSTVKRTEKSTAGSSQIIRQGQGQGQGSQGISGFFIPPTTNTIQKNRNDTPSRLPTATTGKASTLKKSRLYVRADDDSSPDSGDEIIDKRDSLLRNQDRNRDRGPPPTVQYDKPQSRTKVVPLQSHRSAPVTSSSSGMSDAIDQDQGVDMRTPVGNVGGGRKRRKHRTLTSSPSPSPTPVFPPGSPDHPVSSHMSSDRPITPVPDYVLEIHRRLCGRDERIRRNRNESPLKPLVKKSRKEIEKEKGKNAIDERAHDQALIRRRRAKEKENEGGKRLVVGSSQTAEDMVVSPKNHGKRKRGPSPVDMAPLAPVVVNTIRHGAPIKRETTHTDIPTARTRQAHSNAFSPSAVYEELCGHRSPSPPRKVVHTPPKSRSLRRIPKGNSPGSAIPLTSPSPIKPLTPPTSSLSAESMPPPPDSDSGPRYAGRVFKPVPMHAETLLSWSGGLTSTPRKMETTSRGTPVRPDPRPIQHKHDEGHGTLNKVDEKDAETQSLAPSVASQSFPNILPSPTRPVPSMFAYLERTSVISTTAPTTTTLPAKTRTGVIMPETIRGTATLNRVSDVGSARSIARFPSNFGVAETVLPDRATKPAEVIKSKSKSPTTTPKLRSRSNSGWPAFGFDEMTPTNPGNKRPSNSDHGSPNQSSTKKRKSSPTTAKPAGTQSKLAAFGFFGEKPKKAIRGFEEDWEMEDDLPFEMDLDHDHEPESRQEDDRRESGMRAVPPPPPHPALRPAGLKELKKREEALAASRPRFERLDDKDDDNDNDNDIEQLFPDVQASSSQTPAHVGSSTSASASSSFTTDDELTGIGSSAAAWWDGLEDRRSSEFGSFT